MKNGLIRLFSCVLVIFMLSGCLVACGEEICPVMTYKGAELPDYAYRYFASVYKTAFLAEVDGAVDTPSFWESDYRDGQTYGAYCKSIVDAAMRRLTAGLYLFELYDLSLSDALIARIEEDIAEKERYRGEDFAEELAEIGITKDQLKQIYILQERFTAVKDYWVGENGQITITEEILEEYYGENYVCVKHVKLYMDKHITKRADGSFFNDRDLTESEVLAKKQLLTEIATRAENGENFASLQENYAEESVSSFPNGLLFDRKNLTVNNGVFSESFLQNVMALTQSGGKVIAFEDDALGYVLYLCDTLPTRGSLTDGEKLLLDGLVPSVKDAIFVDQMEQFAREVIDTELLATIVFSDIPVNRGFNL